MGKYVIFIIQEGRPERRRTGEGRTGHPREQEENRKREQDTHKFLTFFVLRERESTARWNPDFEVVTRGRSTPLTVIQKVGILDLRWIPTFWTMVNSVIRPFATPSFAGMKSGWRRTGHPNGTDLSLKAP